MQLGFIVLQCLCTAGGSEGCTWNQRSLGVCRPPLKRTECQQQQPNYLSSSSVKLICIDNYRNPTELIPS
jgi:hypothetical protein